MYTQYVSVKIMFQRCALLAVNVCVLY
jgi:hypothetical protein